MTGRVALGYARWAVPKTAGRISIGRVALGVAVRRGGVKSKQQRLSFSHRCRSSSGAATSAVELNLHPREFGAKFGANRAYSCLNLPTRNARKSLKPLISGSWRFNSRLKVRFLPRSPFKPKVAVSNGSSSPSVGGVVSGLSQCCLHPNQKPYFHDAIFRRMA
jgi:hypothetical protein